jgi:hypothetical protein
MLYKLALLSFNSELHVGPILFSELHTDLYQIIIKIVGSL